jgi:O-antigen ligase
LAATLLASGALLVARRRAYRQTEALNYTPLTGEADWQGDWELSTRGADPSEAGSIAGTDRVTIPFTGTGLDLRVRRSNYRAYFWIRIDGEPANRLPQTERGAYLVLSSPDYEPQSTTIPVARALADGPHVAEIVADRGWDQWPLMGWRVERGPGSAVYDQALAGLAAMAVMCLIGVIGCGARRRSDQAERHPGYARPGEGSGEEGDAHLCRRTLGSVCGSLSPILCSPVSLLIAAGVFYISPWLSLTLVSGAALAALIVLRLDFGLALVALSAPFYLHPRPLLGKSFSMAEIVILLCLVSWGLRRIGAHRPERLKSLLRWKRPLTWFRHLGRRSGPWLSTADLAILSLVLVSAVSTGFAARRHVALRELRVVIVEPALFYMMLRTTRLDERAIWRIVDSFVIGATTVALIGLIQYGLGINVITAEQGFRRLRSVYGSPNNAALYLGRALPVLVAVTSFAEHRWRRLIYGVLIVPAALAMLLSFSRAAILLGIPFSLLVLGILAGGRWRWIALALVAIAGIGIIPLMSTPRFAGLLDPQSGTLFFRLQLWRASWKMFSHHPWLGVGPDNFLYEYRGRYILPSAWQEPHLSHAHNLLLTYATRLGLPGLAVGLWLHTAFWQQGLPFATHRDRGTASAHDRRALALGLMGSMAYTLAHGLVDASYFFVDLALAFLLALGLVQWLRRYSTNEQKN